MFYTPLKNFVFFQILQALSAFWRKCDFCLRLKVCDADIAMSLIR